MTTETNNYVLVISQEHKLILETLGELEAILKTSEQANMIGHLKELIEVFKKKIFDHQYFEEEIIFKAALEAMPSERVISIILNLQKEHGIFLNSLETFAAQIMPLTKAAPNTDTIEKNLAQFSDLLKRHSLREVKELFPMITNNSRCRQLIDLYAKRLKNC